MTLRCTTAALLACTGLTATAFAGGGDDAFTAVEITALPFTTTGDTSDNTDQFDVACPFTGSTAPDAWYSYTVPRDEVLAINLCESGYDTKVYVLDTSFNEIACNDDACSDASGLPFRSYVETPALTAGTVVYIVVDGYSGEFGVYEMTVAGQDPPVPCIVECDGTPEGEDADGDCDASIDINGGCNSSPFAITDITCGMTVCGIAWADDGIRDTDWYRLPANDEPTVITCSVVGEFGGFYAFLGENPDCDTAILPPFVTPAPCESSEISATVVGETWWFVGVNDFFGLPCGAGAPVGNDYVISWSCAAVPPPPCPEVGDANGDGVVDFDDLLTVLANFGPCP